MSKTRKQTEVKAQFQIIITVYEGGVHTQEVHGSRTHADVIGAIEIAKHKYINKLINPKP